MITASPPPPAIEQPVPYQLSYGLVSGVAAAGTRRVIVSLVNAMMRSLGLADTDMYGGYEPDELGEARRLLGGDIPLTVDSQPSWGRGKRTSAYDLASLLRAVWLASAGRGRLPVAQPGFTQSDARYGHPLAAVRSSTMNARKRASDQLMGTRLRPFGPAQ